MFIVTRLRNLLVRKTASFEPTWDRHTALPNRAGEMASAKHSASDGAGTYRVRLLQDALKHIGH